MVHKTLHSHSHVHSKSQIVVTKVMPSNQMATGKPFSNRYAPVPSLDNCLCRLRSRKPQLEKLIVKMAFSFPMAQTISEANLGEGDTMKQRSVKRSAFKQPPEGPSTEGPSTQESRPDHGRVFARLKQPSRSSTLGERNSFLWKTHVFGNSRRRPNSCFRGLVAFQSQTQNRSDLATQFPNIALLPLVVALNRNFKLQTAARYTAFWNTSPQIALAFFL